MPDPDAIRQVGDAANDAARGMDGTVWGGVGAVLTAASLAVVRRVRGDSWKETLRENLRETLHETLLESTRKEGDATRDALKEIIRTMRSEGLDTRHELNELGKAISHLAGQVLRIKG